MDADVIVVGAGAAGLAAARWLAERSVRVIVVEARDRLGGLDRMVSIVGGAVFGSLLETTADVWDRQMRLNLRYFFLIAKEVANGMIAAGTQIIATQMLK